MDPLQRSEWLLHEKRKKKAQEKQMCDYGSPESVPMLSESSATQEQSSRLDHSVLSNFVDLPDWQASVQK